MTESRWTCRLCGASFPAVDSPVVDSVIADGLLPACPACTDPDPEAGGSPSPGEDPELVFLAEAEAVRAHP
jgi:hypothetical protein